MNRVRAQSLRVVVVAAMAAMAVVSAAGLAAGTNAVPQYSPLSLIVTGSAGQVTTASLACNPDSGSIRHPKLACAELTAVGGNFDKLTTDLQLLCPDNYAPVTAKAVGSWDGQPVDWSSREYSNICQLQRATGSVFKF